MISSKNSIEQTRIKLYRSAMPQKILLTVSLMLNLLFAAYMAWPKGEDLSEEVHHFTLGILSKLQDEMHCGQGSLTDQAFCREGALFWAAIERLQERRPLAAMDFSSLPEGQLMWGFALSATPAAELKKIESLTLTPLQWQYLYDGLGFGYAVLHGRQEALKLCESTPTLKAFCKFGVGRADLFLKLTPPNAEVDEAAGEVFARHFTGIEKDLEPESAKSKLAARVGNALHFGKPDELINYPCLLNQHLVACSEN